MGSIPELRPLIPRQLIEQYAADTVPDARRVAGFRKWQSLGRRGRKGEKAIRIFGYSTKKTTEEDENGEDIEKQVPRFPILAVFDIGQTDLIDGADDISTVTAQLTGADDFGIIDTLTSYLEEKGWTVQLQPLAGAKNGYTDPEEMTVVIDADLSRAHRADELMRIVDSSSRFERATWSGCSGRRKWS